MKCIFIYNPKSGKGRILSKLDYIKCELEKSFDEVVLRDTKSKEDLIQAVSDACKVYDVIAFSGGDGTFNDVANVVCKEEHRPILGYIPAGTVNDLARNLKIPRNINKAVKIICRGHVIGHDAGIINDTNFVYVAGIGTFTSVSYKTKQDIKKVLGKLAYILDGLEDLVSPKIVNVKITLNDTNEIIEGEYPLVLVLNSKTCGGYPIDRDGHLNDGIFDIICVKKFYHSKRLHALNIVNLFLFGARRIRKITNYYEMYRSSNLDIITDEDTDWTIDGEKGPSGSVHIENLHHRLQIIVPKKHHRPKSKQFLPDWMLELKEKQEAKRLKWIEKRERKLREKNK